MVSLDGACDGGTGTCDPSPVVSVVPASTFYLTKSVGQPTSLIPTDEIGIGTAQHSPVWDDTFDAEMPPNRPTWAIALAHATQVDLKEVRLKVRTAFDAAAAGRQSISFRTEFGPVLDALLLALPVDDPTARILETNGGTFP